MAVKVLQEIRIFPPLVIGRFGSSPEPLENYRLVISDPVDFRKIVPSPTLVVDKSTGEITHETAPGPTDTVAFRDGQGNVKPLAPFIEVWARFDGESEFQPLTQAHLTDLGLSPANVKWSCSAANLKVFRRTGRPKDKVEAETGEFSNHATQPLIGKSKHFKPNKSISFGSVQYIKPTGRFPEVRARFTPGAGLVFGPRKSDPLLTDDVYAGHTACPSPPEGYPGTWDRYWMGAPNTQPVTAPGDIFQGQTVGDTKLSDGYLDDTCDGIINVRLKVGNKEFVAYGRFMGTIPDFAPDSYMARSIADDLEQMTLGPGIPEPSTPQEKKQLKSEVEDILRRALETVRLMNTMVQNGNEPIAGLQQNRNNMAGQQTGYGRFFEPIYDPSQVGYEPVLNMHQELLKIAISAPNLRGAFEFLSLIRPYDEVGDLTAQGRRRMPAMMRGSDGLEFALSRRQYRKLELAGSPPSPPAPAVAPPVEVAPSANLDVPVPPARTTRKNS